MLASEFKDELEVIEELASGNNLVLPTNPVVNTVFRPPTLNELALQRLLADSSESSQSEDESEEIDVLSGDSDSEEGSERVGSNCGAERTPKASRRLM